MRSSLWEASQLHPPGPRSWVVWKLFLGNYYIVHKKGNGRQRRFNGRRAAEAFAAKLNSRVTT